MEIMSACCCTCPGVVVEAHVNKCDCPINREEGAREVKGREECTCVFYDGIFKKGYVVPECEHYEGLIEKEGNEWVVQCSHGDK